MEVIVLMMVEVIVLLMVEAGRRGLLQRQPEAVEQVLPPPRRAEPAERLHVQRVRHRRVDRGGAVALPATERGKMTRL